MRPGERRTREVEQGGGSKGGIMELKSTDGGCLLTGGAAVIFIITRIRGDPHTTHNHRILGTAAPCTKCEQKMERR